MGDTELFTVKMRKATRQIHSISDSLINAKLALSLSNDIVWQQGLIFFYEVFSFLERAIRETSNPYLKQFNMPEIMRTQAFEKDLVYYLGPDWKNSYIPKKVVRRYLNYLGKLERNEPELLIAYVYHLYMGLLSGGQILRKKRTIMNKISPFKIQSEGNAVTEFEQNIPDLKNKIRDKVNEISVHLNEDIKQKLIVEGQMVFKLNNELVRTIYGTNVVYKRILKVLLITFLLNFLYNYLSN